MKYTHTNPLLEKLAYHCIKVKITFSDNTTATGEIQKGNSGRYAICSNFHTIEFYKSIVKEIKLL